MTLQIFELRNILISLNWGYAIFFRFKKSFKFFFVMTILLPDAYETICTSECRLCLVDVMHRRQAQHKGRAASLFFKITILIEKVKKSCYLLHLPYMHIFLLWHRNVGPAFVHECNLSARNIGCPNNTDKTLNIVRFSQYLKIWICNLYYIDEKYWLCVDGFQYEQIESCNHLNFLTIFKQTFLK